MDAQKMLDLLRRGNPGTRFAQTDNMIGVWTEDRYVPCASLTLMGKWVLVPSEILVGGKRVERNWTE